MQYMLHILQKLRSEYFWEYSESFVDLVCPVAATELWPADVLSVRYCELFQTLMLSSSLVTYVSILQLFYQCNSETWPMLHI